MPKVTFLDPRGNPDGKTVEVPAGTNLLEASKEAGAHHGSACGGVSLSAGSSSAKPELNAGDPTT